MKPILQLLHSKVLPWTNDGEPCWVVTRPVMRSTDLPTGASLSRCPLKGQRVVVKDRRKHANQRAYTADWPEANQQEMALPKLACVVSGAADYLLGNYCLHASEGTFILIPPHAPHHRNGPFLDKSHLQNGQCTILFAYAYSHGIFFWFSRSADGIHVNNMVNNYLIPDTVAVQILNLLTEEAISDKNRSRSVCKSLLFAFYTILTREIEANNYMSPFASQEHIGIQKPNAEDFSGQVKEHICANLAKPLKVEEVARQMYMSRSHFSRILRQKTGITFVELLTRCRVERAQELLRETDWTVTFIAGFVGLKSTAYFHELFLERVGCSPIEYRQKHQK